MDLFVFRTAIPFGYLGFWVGVAVLVVAALATVVRGVRARRKAPAIGGGLVALGLVTLAVVNVAADKTLDLNPLIRDQAELAGEWKDGDSALELRADGTFACRGGNACSDLGPAGTWTWRDFEITFRSATDVDVVRRVVRYDRDFRLANVSRDSDGWDRQLSFRRRSAG